MQKMLLKEAEKYAKQNYRRRIWRKFVRVLACVVVFCTTYVLILPAITMERTLCSLDEHTHSESCYEKMMPDPIGFLACTYESLGVHVHTSDCYDGENQLICGQADYLIHKHNDDCVDENGTIVCQIPEVSPHEHTDFCYRVVETELAEIETTARDNIHSHGDECYSTQRGELICQLIETEGHAHGQSCFAQGELICQLTEQEGHTHGEGCSETVLMCSLEVEPHVHGDGCYQQLVCDIPEGEDHTHTEECTGTVLDCDLTEQSHTHTDGCYETHSLCDLPETEGHAHGTACYAALLTCELSEEPTHQHTDECYEMVSVLICELEEGVAPSSTEETQEAAEPVLELVCTEPVAQVHIHCEDCFAVESAEEDVLTCTLPEDENHLHSVFCYGTWDLICGKEEHTHDLLCQNDPEADVETEADWMATFANAMLTGEWDEDLLTIARTQLGYRESTRNYEVMEDGETIKGYTRYGDWYGMPYDDWCAMFVSFCLNYADIPWDAIPYEASCPDWIEVLQNPDYDLYRPAGEYSPVPGDLVFFDWDGDAISDHMGIIEEVDVGAEPAKIKTIEGNIEDRVAERRYELDDICILGYASLPKKLYCGMAEHTHTADCMDEEGSLICTRSEHIHTEECTEAAALETEDVDEYGMLRYQGEDYEVTLRFDDTAGIPANASLVVTELTGDAYQEHLEQTYEAVDVGGSQTRISIGGEETEEVTAISGGITFARFFDLSILVDGVEIEPEGAVEVTIRYDETVEIPDGEKVAVHFTNSGEIEVLSAEKAAPMMRMAARASIPAEETESVTTCGGEFVFLQDSFSVTGTVKLGNNDPANLGTSMDVEWFCGQDESRSLIVYADFTGDTSENKRITIKVPTGYQITSYSATDDTPDFNDVVEAPIQAQFKPNVLTSELLPASEHGSIVGVTHRGTWESQALTGYTPAFSATEKPWRTYGGDIVYTLNSDVQTVELEIILHINQILLSHTSTKEEMAPIQVIVEGTETHTALINVTATGVPVAAISYSAPKTSLISETGATAGRTEQMVITNHFTNVTTSGETGSYFEEAEFTLTYPEGVFLEKDTVSCTINGYGHQNSNYITGLINGETKEVLKNHLSVKWVENADGGGTITWYLEKGHYHHQNGIALGATFTANTDETKGTSYKSGDTITGIEIAMTKHVRNGKSNKVKTLPYVRTVVAGDGLKDVRLTAYNYTKRDIAADFLTEDTIHALGGIKVDATYATGDGYKDNTFYFENMEGLKITALNLMGKNIRDVTVVTNTGREIYLETFTKQPQDNGVDGGNHGTFMDLSYIGGHEGEYIQSCLFTVDLEKDFAYQATYTHGSFIYHGQFQDGDLDGSREGDVILRMLWDNTTHEQVKAAIAAGTLDDLVYINGGTDTTYGGKPIVDTDHSKIGWKSTGVGKVTVEHKSLETGNKEKSYSPNEAIQFTTNLWGGYGFYSNQGVLVDPDLVISLPEGITLDTASVEAKNAKATAKVVDDPIPNSDPIHLEQVGEATTKVIDDVTWTTYRFRVPEDKRPYLIAPERIWNGESGYHASIEATFDILVKSNCDYMTQYAKHMVMWDVINPGYNEDTQGTVNTDSILVGNSGGGSSCVFPDEHNVIGKGTGYQVGTDKDNLTLIVSRDIGLYADIAIKSVREQNEPFADTGYTTYNGLSSSIVPVIPGKYADVRVDYHTTSNINYSQGTVIYVPIPKVGIDYTKFFENINLGEPADNETEAYRKTFGFTVDLTGPVEMSSANTAWTTYYAVGSVITNTADQAYSGTGIYDWEPIVTNNGPVQWMTEAQVTAAGQWPNVVMVKFIAQDNIEAQENGVAKMRLYVRDVDEEGAGVGGTYNYWRGYGKAVTNTETLQGDWLYTSVVAATPTTETLVGQIFQDSDKDGLFDSDELTRFGKYTVELNRADGGMATRSLKVNDDGSFALVDSNGNPDYLTGGDYVVIVRRNVDPNFQFANTSYQSSIGLESPADAWHNNVSSTDGNIARWYFRVTNESSHVHRLGIGLKAVVDAEIKGYKTLVGRTLRAEEFTFLLVAENDAPVNKTSVQNNANGDFTFGPIRYDTPGTYTYKIMEDYSDLVPGINYDGHTATVTVTVTEKADGTLSANVSYDNSAATTDSDKAMTNKAAFTNELSYELPETGGPGTTSYTMGGLLIMLMAAAISLYSHSKKRRNEAHSSF